MVRGRVVKIAESAEAGCGPSSHVMDHKGKEKYFLPFSTASSNKIPLLLSRQGKIFDDPCSQSN